MRDYLRLALNKRIALNALKVALVVGTVLNLINQTEAVSMSWQALNVGKLFLNYTVPYLVATHGGVMAILSQKKKH